MVTIAHLVEKEVRDQPFLEEALRKRLVNYAALAETMHPWLEKELRKDIKYGAVIMALRRLADKLEKQTAPPRLSSELRKAELALKSGIMVIAVSKSPTIFSSLKRLYSAVDFERGDFLTITQGTHEVSILVSQRYRERFMKELKREKVRKVEEDGQVISLRYSEMLIHTPGLIFTITRELAWHGINIIEMASTMTELIIIVHKNDAIRAYRYLQELIEKKPKSN